VSTDEYPMYRRRDNSNESHFTRGNIQVDNRFFVSYNSFLSLKYIAKAYDCAQIVVQANTNNNVEAIVNYEEIKQYLNCRYISS